MNGRIRITVYVQTNIGFQFESISTEDRGSHYRNLISDVIFYTLQTRPILPGGGGGGH